jgi:hypothetical protein
MADRNFVVTPTPGLLDGWWTAPLPAQPVQSGVVHRDEAPHRPPLDPDLLDPGAFWSSAASELPNGEPSLANPSANDQSSLPQDTSGLWGAGQRWVTDGDKLRARNRPVLLANPIVEMVWQPTISSAQAWADSLTLCWPNRRPTT